MLCNNSNDFYHCSAFVSTLKRQMTENYTDHTFLFMVRYGSWKPLFMVLFLASWRLTVDNKVLMNE